MFCGFLCVSSRLWPHWNFYHKFYIHVLWCPSVFFRCDLSNTFYLVRVRALFTIKPAISRMMKSHFMFLLIFHISKTYITQLVLCRVLFCLRFCTGLLYTRVTYLMKIKATFAWVYCRTDIARKWGLSAVHFFMANQWAPIVETFLTKRALKGVLVSVCQWVNLKWSTLDLFVAHFTFRGLNTI